MDPIDTLTTKYDEAAEDLRKLFINPPRSTETTREDITKMLKKSFKTYETIHKDLMIERMFLEATNRESSNKLLRIQARLQALVIWMTHEVKALTPPVPVPSSTQWQSFVKERVRSVKGEVVSVKEILKVYNRWTFDKKVDSKKLDVQDLALLCNSTFKGNPEKREYHDIRVFLDPEDLEEFDKENPSAV